MRKTSTLFFVLFAVFLLQQCKPVLYTVENLPPQFLEFGSMGGVGGAKSSWVFLKNGQVFYKNDLYTEERTAIPKEQVNALFSEAERVKRSGFLIREEGVSMGYILLKSKQHEPELKWLWPYGGSKDVPDELLPLYKQLSKAAKDARPIKK